jgi:hypothetical protein
MVQGGAAGRVWVLKLRTLGAQIVTGVLSEKPRISTVNRKKT